MTRFKAILLIAMLALMSFMGVLFLIPEDVNAEEYVSGSISSDTTWTQTNSPYIVIGNVTVESGVTLTIEPGVEVKFNGSFSLIVNGTLNATGTSSAPINFTSNQTTPSKGDWESIRLQGPNNTLDYCQISYGNYPLYINGSNTNNSIKNCTIFNNTGDGIYLNNTTFNTLVNITLVSNDKNGISLIFSENNTIRNSLIMQNNGSGIFLNSSDNNYIENSNISYNDQDAVYLEESNENSLTYNILFNNTKTGINLTSSSSNNTIMYNNITSNNDTGILITGNSDSNEIVQNDIYNNSAVGINITGAVDNLVHHNNFESNGQNAYDSTNQLNSWDDGMEGNWWSDYTGSDGDGDGIGDTPHDVPGGGSKDFYPLMMPINLSAPIIESTIPANGTQNVSVTPQISITFSSEMNRSAAENATSMSGGLTPTNFSWSNDNKTMTFEPSVTLDSETTYEVNVSTDAKDLLENKLHIDYQFLFSTEDADPPNITSTTPINGSTGIAINANIVVIFSEAIDDTTVTYSSTPDPGGWSVVWSAGNKTATYSHNDFDSETTYTFEITGAKDIAGNDLVAGAVPNPWEFTTEDITPPNITVTSPVNGSIDVLITADIVVTFSEEMNTSSVTYNCTPDPSGWNVVWSGGNTTATYSHNDFDSETNYTFNITGGKDLAGNDLAAGAVPNPWEFTTEDVEEPQITSTIPLNGAVDVLITANVVVNFSEEMNTSSVTFTCNPDPSGWTPSWSNGNKTVTYSHDNFDSETSYIFTITGAKDLAGNDLVAGAVPNPWSFTTEDVIGPEISSTSPLNGAVDVLITTNVVVTFSEEMNTTSVTFTCNPDPLGWTPTWSNGNKTVTYSHDNFDSETSYIFTITGAKDLAGNDLVAGAVPNPWSFTTEDVIGPEISSTSPSNDTIDVLITDDVIVTFNEDMNTSSVTYTCTPDPGGWNVVWSAGNTTATYSHNDFNSTTSYTFEITGGKDPAGNDLVAGAVPNPWTFTTEDVVGPEINSTSPINSSIDILVTADVVVTFNESMNTSSVTFTCIPDPSGWSVVWSAGNTTATYSHNDFNSTTTYTFEITGGKDVAGNDLVAGPVPNPWTFTTEDVEGPEINSTTPLNDSIDVLITADMVVTFNESMNISTVTYTCTPDPEGWSVVWSAGNTTATYSHNDFNSTTTYTFEITGGKDVAGNDLVAGAVPNPWTFTTEDVVGPEINSTSPINSSIDVLVTADVIVNFNEEMNTSSVTYTCTPDPDGWGVVWSAGNTTATYSHNDFNSTTTYTFEITGGKDVAGNDLVAGALPNPWSFTTEDVVEPEITSTTPSNGTIDVLITTNIVVTFSEEMNTSSVTFTCTPDPNGWSIVWSGGNTIATYSHNPFASTTTYIFEITGAKDLAGNDLAAGAAPNPWTFTTEDVQGPIIISTTPADGSINIAQSANIIVTFSEAMNISSVNYICSPNPGGWFVSWSSGDTVATFTHNPFDAYTTYTFQITNGKDLIGNDLTSGAVPNPWMFTTIDSIAPSITATSPSNGSANIGLTQNVVVTFSEAMNTSSMTYSCFPDPGGWSVVWSSGDTVATFSHNAFIDSTAYTFLIANAKDVAGNHLAQGSVPNPWTFTTTDTTSPTIILTSPQDVAVDIALTADVVVSFSEIISTASVAYLCTPDPGGWSFVWSAGHTVATFSHDDFDKSTDYTFQIISAKDMAGNNLVAGGIPNPWSFTTVANMPPTILSTPIITATEEVPYTYDVEAIDSDGGTLTYSLFSYPLGMTINSTTGLIIWTPTNSQVGANSVIVTVSDGEGGSESQSFSVTVNNVNDPPMIISTPFTDATEDVQYNYDVDVSDIDGDTLTFSLTTYPAGMVIDDSSGLITWTPTNSQVGVYSVVVLVSDGNGGTDTQSFEISVKNANDAPTITSTPITTATEDELYVYDVEAQDVDVGDTLTFSLTAFPTGMTIDTTSGLVEWTPTNAQVGVNSVTVVVSDENGSTATQQFTITVTNVNDPPTITSIPITAATEDIQYTYDVDASDIDGDFLNYSLSTYPAGMTIDNATGLITWTPSNSQVGNNNVYIIVSDGKAGTDTQSFIISVVNANDAPTITSTPITTAVEDSLYIYDVEANDVDSGDTLTYSLTAYPLGMTIDSATGMIQWTPTNDQIGANGVTALVMDGNGANDTQSFIITVSNTNDAPTVISAPQTTATEDVQYTYDVEAYDPDSDTLTFSLNTYPAGMTINTTTGLITWTPTNSQVGANNVYILVSDGKGGTGTQSFTIFVENANDAPTITSTPITTATEDELYVYDVEVTDVDVGDNLTFGLTAYPMGMTINATTGLIEWTPTNAQVGANPVTLMVSDENGSTDTQSFTITVSNTNNPPDIYSVPITAATEDILYNYDVEAQDPDDDTLTYSLTTYPTGMAIDGPSGLISWTPINSQVGAHSVVVQVLDGIGGTDTQGFTVTVLNTNDPPTITSTPITTATDDVLYTYDVDASDIDVGDTLTYSLTSYPTGMEINSTNGLITWTPTDDHVGSNSITILVSDSEGKTDTQSYSISVADINDPPTISSIAPTAAIEDTEYIYYVEALDPDSDILSFSLTINPNGMTINSMIGLIQWTPTNEQVGANNVVVQVLDGNGGSDTQTFTIFVENVNDAPTIISTPITTATEDELYTYDVDATDIDVGDTLTFSLTEYPTGMSIDAVSGLIEWTPTNNQVGTNPVTVVVMDENGSTDNQIFTITVSNVNDPPSITSTPPTTAIEDTEYAYDVNALDPDNDMLSFSLSTYPNGMTIDAAGLITWTPINDQVGINNVAVMVMDGKGGSDTQTFAITVSNVNDPPTITSTPILTATEDLTYSYDVEADDVDVGDTLTFSLTAYPDGMTINIATGLIEWIPTNAQVGVNPVFLVVSDESGSNDTQSFTITVSNTNDAPSITSTPITAATEDIQYIYDVEASDIDGDSLNYNLSTYPAGMTIDSATGLITWTPTNSDVGVNSVNVMVSDGNGGIVTQTFNITVSNTNDPPTIISGSITTATQNTLYTYDVEATDVDDDTLTFSLTAFPQGMTIDPATGVISWIPNSTQVGGNSVTVEVFDGNSGRDTQSFTITVANVNDQPEFISQPVTIATEETEYFYEVEVYDIDGDILTYSLVNYPNGMTIESATGIITWTPTNAQVGTHSIAIGVVDGNGGYAQQTFTITVSDVNDPPVIIPTPATQAIEEVLYTYQIQAEDQDPADTMLRFELAIYPQGMQINSTTGIINWTPTYAQVGDNPVTVMVYDKIGTSDTLSFNINVANVNDVPIIISGPITTAVEEAQYYYHVNAQDDDFGDTLTYNLTTAPVGMDIDALTNIISWVPADSQVGTHQVVLKVTDNHGASTTQSFYITVENVNDAPELSDSKVSPETGDSKDRYTFTLAYKDPDGDPGAVKLVINGREYEMTKIGGDAVTGAIYSIEMGLGARTHSYYFEIDDGEDHIVVSEVNELSVSAAEKEEEEDLLPIPLWWIILILIIIIVAVLIYLGRVKRQVNRLKRFQQFSEKIDRMQYKKQELGGVEREEMAEKAETKKAGETLESEEPEEEEESEGPLLEFSQ